ncbi:MAG: WecB/TagA/CpsF family glycosyltransferase [Thermodesulfobacteriota bacterium]
MRQLEMLGIKVTAAGMVEIHAEIDRLIGRGGPGFILSVNAHAVNLARTRPWLADFFKQADVVHVDGGGIILAAKAFGYRIPQRITWADWWPPLSRHIADRQYRLFLLGGPEGLPDAAAARIRQAFPRIRIVGTQHGFFQKRGPENEATIRLINRAAPDILWVGMGMPLQEKWVLDNCRKLNVKVFMICGSAYRYMAGLRTRAPRWMLDNHMEWLWMLLEEPRRGLVRYLWGNPLFLMYTLVERLKMKNTAFKARR